MYWQRGRCTLTCVFAVALSVAALAVDGLGAEPYRLQLAAPIETWDEAVPLGNGLTGGLLWRDGKHDQPVARPG